MASASRTLTLRRRYARASVRSWLCGQKFNRLITTLNGTGVSVPDQNRAVTEKAWSRFSCSHQSLFQPRVANNNNTKEEETPFVCLFSVKGTLNWEPQVTRKKNQIKKSLKYKTAAVPNEQ